MSKITKFNTRLAIYHEWKVYKIAVIWYSKDWWYFIKDFSNINDVSYIATKVKVGNSWKRINKFKFNYEDTYRINISKPKLSHHFNWNAHISWENIISWYNDDWTPKWLSIKSMHLLWKNDWGPLFSICIWSKIIEKFEILDMDNIDFNKPQIIFNEWVCLDLRENKNNINYSYVIDWYYIPKNEIPENAKLEEWLIKNHPNFWFIPVFPISTPLEIPWVIVVHYRRDIYAKNPNFFSFWWAPWIVDENWNWEQLWIMMNITDKKIYKNLDYNK